MNITEVIEILKSNQNEEGIKKWELRKSGKGNLKSFGIGLTKLRKLAKQIGRDHSLALQLWEIDIYDARIIALLIDDPRQITKEQAEMQVKNVKEGYLAHVFSSCDAALAKTPFVAELLLEWINSDNTMKRSCGYGLLYEVSKSKKKSAPDEVFFLERIDHIHKTFKDEHIAVQGSMGGALIGVGKRSAKLNAAALKVARAIGPIHFASEGKQCEPLDVVKHLTSDYIKKKLGV